MQKGLNLSLTPAAVAELVRQASLAGTPGLMHIDLLEDTSSKGWIHINIKSGHNDGVPIARDNGITLYTQEKYLPVLQGLKLNYFGDLSGGGFLISTPLGAECCACGAGFRFC